MEVVSYASVFHFYFLNKNNSNKDRKKKHLQADVEISGPDSPEFNYEDRLSHVSRMTSLLMWKYIGHDVAHFLQLLSFLILLTVPETRLKWARSELVIQMQTLCMDLLTATACA